MPESHKVAVLVGSLRQTSFNRKLAHALIAAAPSSLAPEIVEIGDLPLYNEDLENAGEKPAAWLAFRDRIRESRAVLFVTPEYNRSVPGVLKNALDVGSRPYGHSVWSRKPAAIISLSTGGFGAFGANHHLRQSLVFLDMPAMQQPEAYLGGASTLFDADGRLLNEKTQALVTKFMTAFGEWVNVHTRD